MVIIIERKLIGEKVTMFELGDKVRVKSNAPTGESICKALWIPCSMDITKGKEGFIIENNKSENYARVKFYDTSISLPWNYHYEDLEKITEEKIMKPELKLEIGKKYNLQDYCDNPYIFLDDSRKHGFKFDEPLVFRDCRGHLIQIDEADIDSAEEYREPYKKIIEGWLAYDDVDATVHHANLTSQLLNKKADSSIYSTNGFASGDNAMHVRITLEEI